MKTSLVISSTPQVQGELHRLNSAGILKPLDSEYSPGILRGINGNTNTRLLNSALPHARYQPLLNSRILFDAVAEFNATAAHVLGTGRYMLKGYAGRTTGDGALAELHVHDGMRAIVNTVIASEDGTSQPTTMFYEGPLSAEPFRDRPITEALEGLGVGHFTQLEQGQIAEFGPTDFHGEPPLPEGLGRMLLVAYSYE